MNDDVKKLLITGAIVGGGIFALSMLGPTKKGGKKKKKKGTGEEIETKADKADEMASEVVGEDVDDATKMIEDAGLRARVTKEDGKSKMYTGDVRSDRVNLEVKDGEVVAANVG